MPLKRAARRRPFRVWSGVGVAGWLRLLRQGGFRVSPVRLPAVARTGVAALANTALGAIDRARSVGHRPEPPDDPVVVLGHWRSGTTLLHELLACHPALVAPTLYQTLAPLHFPLTEDVVPALLRARIPSRRPMDDIPIDASSPFEDEFALCLMGARSPYATLAFPNGGPMTPDMFDPEGFAPRERLRWREAMRSFAARVAAPHPGRRLVLKSPPHTCRIRTLLELFPRASFVHVVRDPVEVFPSTLHLWRSLHRTQGWQRPDGDGLEEMVLTLHDHVFACYERDRARIPPGRLHEVRYERLVQEPAAVADRLGRALGIGREEDYARAVADFLQTRAGYRPNDFRLDARTRARVRERWGDVARRWGYAA